MDTLLSVFFPQQQERIDYNATRRSNRLSCILAEGAEEIQTSDAGGEVWQSHLVRIA